jgi:hypothetical protein
MARDIVSIERVLNSRCSSDSSDAPRKSHWGTFLNRFPPQKTIDRVLSCCNIPRFSNERLELCFENGDLLLGFEKPKNLKAMRMLHIESGMQQEAVYLACVALGLGTCIHNQGINGTENEEKITTAKFTIMEIDDPYETGKFTTKPPGPEKPFEKGKNLSDPLRDGDVECLQYLKHLSPSAKSGSKATEKDISQLLWAAKGRTPHYIRLHVWKKMWGLTIPTWGGGQNYTSVYLLRNGELFRYINWTKEFSLINRAFLSYIKWTRGAPTHDLRFIRRIAHKDAQLDEADTAIILCQNENTGRSLWEVGYMLENIFLQAKSIGISHDSKLLETEETSRLTKLGAANAVTAVLF